MSDSGAQSTPVSTKEREGSNHEMMDFMKLLLENQNTMFCTKFDEVKQQNVKFEKCFDNKFDEIKEQYVKFKSNFSELKEKMSDTIES